MEAILSKTMDQHQAEIIEAFAALADDRAMMLDYLMEVGVQLPPMKDPSDHHLIAGCMSKVWLSGTLIGNHLFFQADSDTAITKGLISLLLKVVSGQLAKDIVAVKFYFLEKIDMHALIGFQRTNGLAHMVATIKLKALATCSAP